MAVASAVVAVAYIVFIVVLARSSSNGDRDAGLRFMLNAPTLIGLVIASMRSARAAVQVGASAAFGQFAIMTWMLLTPGYHTNPVLIISFAVVIPVLAITAWAWFRTQSCSVSLDSARGG